MVMMLLQQVSCISQTILENNVFSCGTFAISFSVFSSTLLAPQWITICLTAGGNSSFSAHHTKFLTLSLSLPIYHNLMCPSRKMNSMPLYIWRVLELMSRQVILSVYFCLYLMLTYVVGVIYAIPVYKIVQRVLIFATVRGCILTVCGHSLVRVSIWYSSLWCVVLLSSFWCFKEIYDPVKLWKFKIKRKPLEKSVFSRQLLHL